MIYVFVLKCGVFFSVQETRRSGLGPEEQQQLQGLKEGGRHYSTPKHTQHYSSPEGRSVRHGNTCERASISPSPEPGSSSQRLERKKIRVSKHRDPSTYTKPSYSNHGGQECPIHRLDPDTLKHVETKKRHHERERRQERKGEGDADERKARIIKKLEAKKKKKERQEKRSHHERKGSHRKGDVGGESGKKTKDERKRAKKTERNIIKNGQKDHIRREMSPQTPCVSLSKSPDSAIFESSPPAAFSDTSLCIHKYTKHKGEDESNCDSDSSHTSGFISPSTPPLANQNNLLQCQSKDIANNITSEHDNNLPFSESTSLNTSGSGAQNKQHNQENITAELSASSKLKLPKLDPSSGLEAKIPQTEEKNQHAPDLLPAHSNSMDDHLRLDPSASPPVLSWQGSPVSDISEEEEDEAGPNIAGVIRRPVLQPSPTHSSPIQDLEDIWKEQGHPLNLDFCHSDLAKTNGIAEPSNVVEKKEDKDPMAEQKDSSTITSQGPHLHDTDGTLASDSHKYTYRGGPFGWPPPNSAGVKYSSSLSLGPEIHPPEQHSPTSTPPRALSAVAMPLISLSPSTSTSDLSNPDNNMEPNDEKKEDRVVQEEGDNTNEAGEFLKEPICTSLVRENEVVVQPFTLSPDTLQDKLADNSKVLLNQSSSTLHLLEVNSGKKKSKTKLEKKKKKKKEQGKDRKRRHQKKQKTRTGSSDATAEPNIRGRRWKKKQKNTKGGKQHCSSSHEPAKQIAKDHNKQEVADSKPTETQKEQRKGTKKTVKAKEETNDGYSELLRTSFSSISGSIAAPAVRVSSSVPLKELKIHLVKLKISGKETFIASEFEQKRISLKELSINNSAAEIIRACM